MSYTQIASLVSSRVFKIIYKWWIIMIAVKFLKSAVIAAVFAGLVSVANAGSVSYTGTVADGQPDFTTPVLSNVPQKFDASLGTLDSVVVTYSGRGTASYNVTNNGVSAMNVNYNGQISATLISSDSALTALLATDSVIVDFGTGVGVPNRVSIGGGATTTFGTYDLSTGNTISKTYTGSSDKSLFIGTGSLGLSGYAEQSDTVTTSGDYTGIKTSNFGMDVTVTYNYTVAPVPEPSSLALVGLGIAGVVVARRRRRA